MIFQEDGLYFRLSFLLGHWLPSWRHSVVESLASPRALDKQHCLTVELARNVEAQDLLTPWNHLCILIRFLAD